jgi:hypothetical protein
MDDEPREIKLRDLFKTWWPIAISWVLLAFEPLFFSSIISRYPNAKVNLAAYGNVAWMLPIVMQSPIMLIQAASASLCKDKETFYKLRKFANWMGMLLTLLHLLIAVTPLYYFVVRTILNVPEEVVAVARQGLLFMLPWSWSISYRRFHQGILVRFGHTKRMSFGTIMRMVSDVICVFLLAMIPGITGLAVATAAQGFSVFLEGAYIGIVTQPVIKNELPANTGEEIIGWRTFGKYYFPFMMNSIIFVLYTPMNSAAMGRLPMALASLATWPVVNGFTSTVINLGQASREVTLTYIRHEGSYRIIRKFCMIVGAISFLILGVFSFTPLFNWYLSVVVKLPQDLIPYAKITLRLVTPIGMTFSLSNMYTGLIAYSGKTISLLSSTIVMLLVVFAGLVTAIFIQPFDGIYVVAGVYVIASVIQLGWLFWSNRDSVAALEHTHSAG